MFRNLTAHKCAVTGFYYRGETAYYENLIGADNGLTLFMAYNQWFTNSLLVGESANTDDDDRRAYQQLNGKQWGGYDQRMRGLVTYDGPINATSVHFAGYPATQQSVGSVEITPIPISLFGGDTHYQGQLGNITFETPAPYRKIDFRDRPAFPTDARTHVSMRDVEVRFVCVSECWFVTNAHLQGALYGRRGAVLVPNHPFHNTSDCVEDAPSGVLACTYEVGVFSWDWYTVVKPGKALRLMNFTVTRSDGAVLTFPTLRYQNNQFMGISNRNLTYTVQLDMSIVQVCAPITRARLCVLTLRQNPAPVFASPHRGIMSPVYVFAGVSPACNVTGVLANKRVATEAALHAATSAAYWVDANGVVHARAPTGQRIWDYAWHTGPMMLVCP